MHQNSGSAGILIVMNNKKRPGQKLPEAPLLLRIQIKQIINIAVDIV